MSSKFSRSASLMGYRELVDSLGGDATRLFSLAGISEDQLSSDDNLVPSEQLVALLELSSEILNCSNFGIQLARRQTLSMLGPVGLLVQQCDSLGDAIDQLKKFLYIHSQAGLLTIRNESQFCYVDFEPLVDHHGHARQLVELSLVAGINILSELVGRDIPLHSVYFSYRKPKDVSLHHQIFKSSLTFEREISGVSFDRKYLSWPLHAEKVRIKQFISQYVESIERQNQFNLEGRVRTFIRQLLPLGQCSVSRISELLQVDKRTLQRRLGEQGISYQVLLEEERKGLAIRYLKESDVSLTHLSDLLGYSELSVFSRNFKKWLGITPTEYMKQETERLRYR